MSPQSFITIMVLTVITGWADARGFLHASAIWDAGRFAPLTALKAAGYFTLGIPVYMLTLYHLRRQGIMVAELQVTLWFVITIIGVAVMSGRIFTWSTPDRLVAALVVAGMIWLMVRVGS